jgi:recombinational DNA repair protein (RecF pathway)
MHHIYHTEAIVVDATTSKETDMVYFVLTKELGLLYAVAHGVRAHQSKLRYALQIGSHIMLDLIKAKDMWQVTSAIPENGFQQLLRTQTGRRLWSRFVLVMKRMAPKDEPDEELWSTVTTFCSFVSQPHVEEHLYRAEIYFMHTLLSYLGYTTRRDNFALTHEAIEEHISSKTFHSGQYIQDINRAFRQSHL